MKKLLFFALMCVPFMVSGGGPKRIDQTLCYDWDAATGVCGSTVTIHTHPEEKGRLYRADTLRQVKAADMGYTALTGRLVVDDGGGCNWGDPSCATCKSKFPITGTMYGCDGPCMDCTIRPKR